MNFTLPSVSCCFSLIFFGFYFQLRFLFCFTFVGFFFVEKREQKMIKNNYNKGL